MKIPEKQNTIQNLIDLAHENASEKPRGHLGCSILGHPCDRYIWLQFRYAVIEKFNGRMLRLFRRGHKEEESVVSDLRRIGIDIQATGGNQSRVNFGCHVSGSIDGIIESGVPESPKKRHILEVKTHSKKSFDQLTKEGVKKAKPQHYMQMQLYMHGTGIDRALYYAVCKDDDRIHTERVKYEKETAEQLVKRGHWLALAERMPEPLSTSPDWYQCKFCAAHSFCHDTKLTKEINCRTCSNSTPTQDSEWLCARYENAQIPYDAQIAGCNAHVLHPDLVPWQRKDGTEWTAVYVINGKDVETGEPCANVFSSAELLANPDACASGSVKDSFIAEARDLLGAVIVPMSDEIMDSVKEW